MDHWERVNAAGNAMLLGTLTLANLTTKRNDMEAKNKEIRHADLSLSVAREEREDTSIIVRLRQYHAAIPVRRARSRRRRGAASRWWANWTCSNCAPPTATRWPTATATRTWRGRPEGEG